MSVEKLQQQWNVSDCDPVNDPPKDCRLYNGGRIAPPEVQKFWATREELEIINKNDPKNN